MAYYLDSSLEVNYCKENLHLSSSLLLSKDPHLPPPGPQLRPLAMPKTILSYFQIVKDLENDMLLFFNFNNCFRHFDLTCFSAERNIIIFSYCYVGIRIIFFFYIGDIVIIRAVPLTSACSTCQREKV